MLLYTRDVFSSTALLFPFLPDASGIHAFDLSSQSPHPLLFVHRCTIRLTFTTYKNHTHHGTYNDHACGEKTHVQTGEFLRTCSRFTKYGHIPHGSRQLRPRRGPVPRGPYVPHLGENILIRRIVPLLGPHGCQWPVNVLYSVPALC